MNRKSGEYDLEMGKIYIPMENMKKEDDWDAYGTYIHELQHVHLNCLTVIGQIAEILQKEKACTPSEAKSHLQKVTDLLEILGNAVLPVQEVYANTMELLWIEEYQGIEAANLVYHRKSVVYQQYSKKLRKITEKYKEADEKRNAVQQLCVYAINLPISTSRLIKLLSEPKSLKEYFNHEGNLNRRLEEGIEELSKERELKWKEPRIPVDQIILALIESKICVYAKELVLLSEKISEAMSQERLKEMVEQDYQDMLVKRIQVFRFAAIEEKLKILPFEWTENYFAVVRHTSKLLYPQENWMLMGWSEKEVYIGQEVDTDELEYCLQKADGLVIPFEEFDVQLGKPKYFKWTGMPLFVILQNYYTCEGWLTENFNKDIFLLDLYPEEINNFYTVLFFRKRQEPDIIFVFPALKYLVKLLLQEAGLSYKVKFPEDKQSLKLFACFKDEKYMLKALIWLMGFISGTGWDGGQMKKAASMLSAGIVKSILESALQIKRKDYWKIQSCLPTEDTKSVGLYAFMRFEQKENTGEIEAKEYSQKSYPLFFQSRKAAENYEMLFPHDKNWKLVGIDDYYWQILKEYLKQGDGKWCLWLDETKGLLLDIEVYEKVCSLLHFFA